MKSYTMTSLGITLIFCFAFISFARSKSVFYQQHQNLYELKDTSMLVEYYVDSINIGRSTKNKIELSLYRNLDTSFVTVKFYTKNKLKWILKNDFNFNKDEILGLKTRFTDLNNDGFKDVTFIYNVAGRGSNEIRKLLIFDHHQDQLIDIKNSENYPNILYNHKLDCLDAFLVYGGSSTVFLKIKNDSLKEFAIVDLNEGLYVTKIDSLGERKVIQQFPQSTFEMIRFKNFDPLEPYTEEDLKQQ